MEDKKILDRISEELKKEEIPSRLRPENIDKLLSDKAKPNRGIIYGYRKYALIAAAVLLVVIVVPLSVYFTKEDNAGTRTKENNKFGNVLYAASDYKEVRKAIKKVRQANAPGILDYVNGALDGFTTYKEYATDSIDMAAEESENAAETSKGSYSSTNVRTAGVDEGDIVKTDGEYIYAIKSDGNISITRAKGEDLERVCDLTLDFDSSDATVRDMYVAEDLLVAIADCYNVDYSQEENEDYYLNEKNDTRLVVYDISNKKKPKKKDIVNVDGSYNTSRLADGCVYLFTWYYGGDIPLICDKLPDAGDIYLAKEMDSYSTFTMTAVSIDESGTEVKAEKVIYMDASDVYVSYGNVYLQGRVYGTQGEHTNIIKFAYGKGKLNDVGINSVPGYTESSFSIDEGDDGILRVATTAWGVENKISGVYIFDKNMKALGNITGLAKGEDIKAARFIGDMLYLVTYENHDPIFTIDLSDANNPKLIGKLEIPGFSDYLHPWDENHLLGIGYETDVETSELLGIKLSMYDISDPTNVIEENVSVISHFDDISYDYRNEDVPGLSNYKALMISNEKNLIGFAANSYANSYTDYIYGYDDTSQDAATEEETNEVHAYYIFRYTENGFEMVLKQDAIGAYADGMRGIYIDDTVYVVDDEDIKGYDFM